MKFILKLSVAFATLFCCATASAYDFKVDGICYDKIGVAKDQVEVAPNPDSPGYFGNIVIPSSVTYEGKSYPVTGIGEYAFEGCSFLKSITIPNSVTSIGSGAFYDCSGLTSIDIPNSVTSIGIGAFYDCSGLTSIDIPNSVTSIGEGAFSGCSGLTSIDIPNSVMSIGDRTFQNCSGLTSIDIPNSVTGIGEGAFRYCSGLTSIDIPNSVTGIGEGAFSSCSGLTSIDIPNSVTSIGNESFSGCSSLTSVSFGSGLQLMGDRAFVYCHSLSDITCYGTVPPITLETAFDTKAYDKAELYVPQESLTDYKSDDVWKLFKNINTIGVSGIEGVAVDGATDGEQTIYDLQGRKLQEPVRGQVNIINGKKVFVEK